MQSFTISVALCQFCARRPILRTTVNRVQYSALTEPPNSIVLICQVQSGMSGLLVRAVASLLGRWLLPRVRQHSALSAVSWRSDLRGAANTQQLRRQNFCSRWTSLVALSSGPAVPSRYHLRTVRRQLKRHLFQEAWTRLCLTSNMWRLRKTL